MQILAHSVVTLLLLFWLLLLMTSPMMFDAPGSDNKLKHVLVIMLVLAYPIGLFLILWLLGINYFGISSFKLAIISFAVISALFFVFGFFGMLLNLYKGIANTGYSTAKHKAYYNGKPIADSDGSSFQFFQGEGHYQSAYASDNKHIYYRGNIVEGGHGASFRILDSKPYSWSEYAADRQHFYYRGRAVEGVSAVGLRKEIFHNESYWLNDSQVIYDGKVLAGANPDTFSDFDKYSGWTYSTDGEQYTVFNYGLALPPVDKATFTPLNSLIAKDKQHIFYKNQFILSGADAATFELLEGDYFARDKQFIYCLGEERSFAAEDIDPESFEILARNYLKDKHNVYFLSYHQRIETLAQADPRTFEVTGYDSDTETDARDKHHFYLNGKLVKSQ